MKPRQQERPPISVEEEFARIHKPGMETSLPHIAQLFLKHQPEVAIELTRTLRPHCAARLGVIRRTKRLGGK